MEQLLINLLFWGVFVGGGSVFVIFCFVMAIRQYRRDIAQKTDINQGVASNDPAVTTVTIKATVVEQTCCVKTTGIKTPKTIQEFSVIFKTENGEILKLNVPEEMYDGFEEGQFGILSVIDGELYGFDLEETDPVV